MKHFQPIQGRKIRVALAGCGRISKNHFDALGKQALADRHALLAGIERGDLPALRCQLQRLATGRGAQIEHAATLALAQQPRRQQLPQRLKCQRCRRLLLFPARR